jgi:hypothetical protein
MKKSLQTECSCQDSSPGRQGTLEPGDRDLHSDALRRGICVGSQREADENLQAILERKNLRHPGAGGGWL